MPRRAPPVQPPPAETPFDYEPGTRRDTKVGRHEMQVEYIARTWSGRVYGTNDPGRGRRVTVRVSTTKPARAICLTCNKADDCYHAWAALKIHRQLWGEG